jgi:serine O-acetyltransferase
MMDLALIKIETCFDEINLKYYRDEQGSASKFDHLNGDHFATLLYFLSNLAWIKFDNINLATKLFYLNKIMHGIDLFYTVQMPDIFLLVHPVGTVLGNAHYDDYFVAYQNVTVGADEAGFYPIFGKETILYSKSSVIGECTLGSNVVLGSNSFVLNSNVPSNSLVVGQFPYLKVLPNLTSVKERIFQKNRDYDAL